MTRAHFRERTSVVSPEPIVGRYNFTSFFEFSDRVNKISEDEELREQRRNRDTHFILRLAGRDIVQFPDFKILAEVATMRHVRVHTDIPVPLVYAYGLADDNPANLCPFIIMEYMKHEKSLVQDLGDPEREFGRRRLALDANVSDEPLAVVWDQLASYLLQLYAKMEIPCIGSLHPQYDSTSRRAPTLSLFTGVPHADDWYVALADMHMAQLVFQQNDLTSTSNAFRTMYVARQLFRQLARAGKLSSFGFGDDTWSAQARKVGREEQSRRYAASPGSSGPFRLWCDDLSADNFLLDKDRVVTGFALDPPAWLLFCEPGAGPEELDEWSKTYASRLPAWLRSMEKAEAKAEAEAEAEATPTMEKDKTGLEVERDLDQAAEKLSLEDPAPKTIEENPPSPSPSTPTLTNSTDANTPLPAKMSRYMRESWETGRFWLNSAARSSVLFDYIYWAYLDERFFGPRKVSTGHEVPELWRLRQYNNTDAKMERRMQRDIEDHDFWRARIGLLGDDHREAMHTLAARKMDELREGDKLVDWADDAAREHLKEFLKPS
ncbi:hypothetical protein B0T26DRAFT_753693 [Lasiosphaeria miniovina]|uniref:Aminoglycoside phosphotransferase domain-containing protein n=1 Tax=Lasiosphaeria miniovina TaxID=1954250 RepID=A0AA40DUE2_9PEZI|nr:uncharacterized protein B0T26DRAFT_753693 [Lasiosphaeria miniovina]KAK0713601.1 hypothetical protein B0T26DRAFT_753693 [Lasiosphaeria miniovina]